MKFIREISEANITERNINDLEQFGYTLIWKESSVEIWVET
jgi:hypothetical protein